MSQTREEGVPDPPPQPDADANPYAPPPPDAPLLRPDARGAPRPQRPTRPPAPRPRPPRRSGPPVQGGVAAGLLSLFALFFAADPLPWSAAALASGLAGAGLGARLLHRARQAGAPAPGALVAVIAGTIGALLALQVVTLSAANWSQLSRYRDCLAGANTVTAHTDCQAQFRDLRQRLWFLNGG